MFLRKCILTLGGLFAVAVTVPAYAQDSNDPSALAMFRVGPVLFRPTFNLGNVGLDTNVNNDAAGQKRDITATVTPGLLSWLHVGPALVSSRSTLGWMYFSRSIGERAVNYSQDGRLDMPFAHFTPYVSGSYGTTHQRPNLEIDARVRQTTVGFALGTTVQVGPRTRLDVSGERSRVDFANQQFLGVSLAQELNRTSTVANATVRMAVTPLTTVVLRTDVQRDRFSAEPLRDTNMLTVAPGLEFKASALITGSAFVGFRRLDSVSGALPGFRGAVANVNLAYLLSDMTRFSVVVDRTLEYSFEKTQPYYIVTGGNVSMTQSLGGRWDTVLRVGRTRMAYQNAITLEGQGLPQRRDRSTQYGLGLGYRLAVDARIGFDTTYQSRRSIEAGRGYTGYRFGGSFAYAF